MSSCVKFEQIRKVFVDSRTGKTIEAVKNISLEIQSGQLVTLLGPSGCGKTTVLRMLAGFENPTSGEILLDGKSITHLPPNERNSAMVFQSYALFPHMSVEENIAYGLRLRKFSKAEQGKKLDRILDVVNLRGYETRRPNELSGGQQQRVALARALIVEPSILLFDEPLSNLDAKLRESMRNEIRSIQQKLGITAVYVTHDQSEAMAISDLVVVMNQGQIDQKGSSTEVYFHPKTAFVADFMGAANFLKAQVIGSDNDRLRVRLQERDLKIPNYLKDRNVTEATADLIVRPECIQVGDSDGWDATIEQHHFLGATHEYHLKLATGEKLIARPAAHLGGRSFDAGQKVRVTFAEENLHVLL